LMGLLLHPSCSSLIWKLTPRATRATHSISTPIRSRRR